MNPNESGHQSASRSKRVLPKVILGLLALTAALWVANDHGLIRRGAADTDAPEPTPIMELAAADVATVSEDVLSRSLPVTGSLSPLVQTTVKAQAPGEVLEVTVREGQSVQSGDLLVRIDTRNLEAELASQQAELERARADLSLAVLNREKSAVMLEKKFISHDAHDTTENLYQAGAASVKAAQARLNLAQIALEHATVRAPFAGTIAQRLVQPGEKVEIGTSLLMLVDLSRLELQAPVSAHDVPAVRVGQVAKFRVGGFGDRRFEGRVERINPMTDTGSRSVMIYLSVDNPESVLKGGVFAQGDLVLDATAPVTAIPLTAVRSQAGMPFVFVVDDDRISMRYVKLGLEAPEQNRVEVREGVKTGELVVAARIDTLKDGSPVVVVAPAVASAAIRSR